jgi:predicted nucleic acid-binding protein
VVIGPESVEDVIPDDSKAALLAVIVAQRAAVVYRPKDKATFSPLPFGMEAARQYGIIAAEIIAIGRKPRGRVADLMIASIAAANRLPLFTTNPEDFRGIESVVRVVPVPVPVPVPVA